MKANASGMSTGTHEFTDVGPGASFDKVHVHVLLQNITQSRMQCFTSPPAHTRSEIHTQSEALQVVECAAALMQAITRWSAQVHVECFVSNPLVKGIQVIIYRTPHLVFQDLQVQIRKVGSLVLCAFFSNVAIVMLGPRSRSPRALA